MTQFVHFMQFWRYFIPFLIWFRLGATYQAVLVPAASHGCQNMTKGAVLVVIWTNLCNQYRELPRQILLFIWPKNMFFCLVSASLGQIWTFLRTVFRRPVNVALKEGWFVNWEMAMLSWSALHLPNIQIFCVIVQLCNMLSEHSSKDYLKKSLK